MSVIFDIHGVNLDLATCYDNIVQELALNEIRVINNLPAIPDQIHVFVYGSIRGVQLFFEENILKLQLEDFASHRDWRAAAIILTYFLKKEARVRKDNTDFSTGMLKERPLEELWHRYFKSSTLNAKKLIKEKDMLGTTLLVSFFEIPINLVELSGDISKHLDTLEEKLIDRTAKYAPGKVWEPRAISKDFITCNWDLKPAFVPTVNAIQIEYNNKDNPIRGYIAFDELKHILKDHVESISENTWFLSEVDLLRYPNLLLLIESAVKPLDSLISPSAEDDKPKTKDDVNKISRIGSYIINSTFAYTPRETIIKNLEKMGLKNDIAQDLTDKTSKAYHAFKDLNMPPSHVDELIDFFTKEHHLPEIYALTMAKEILKNAKPRKSKPTGCLVVILLFAGLLLYISSL